MNNKSKYLPKKAAWTLLGLAALACFGENLPMVDQVLKRVTVLDAWNCADAPFAGIPKYLFLVMTAAIAWKQMSYYYYPGGTKGAAFSKVILHMNPIERSIDWILAFHGALLLPWSVYHPTTWVVGFLLYCVIALCRMWVTLKRPCFSQKWMKRKGLPSFSNPWSTYPFDWVAQIHLDGMPAAPDNVPEERLLLERLEHSLLAKLIPPERPEEASSAREILYGWFISFAIHGSIASIFCVSIIGAIMWLGPGTTRWLSILFICITTLFFYFGLSRWSLRMGKKHFHDASP